MSAKRPTKKCPNILCEQGMVPAFNIRQGTYDYKAPAARCSTCGGRGYVYRDEEASS